jgi:hypothetical protein
MDVNKFKLLKNDDNQYQIVLPIQTDNFYLGLDMGIDEIETEVVTEVIGLPKNYEISRFVFNDNSSLNINFKFFNFSTNSWESSYLPIFQQQQIYYNTTAFSNSFFKLDFYDKNDNKNQKIIFTVVIPTQQGKFENVQIFPSWYTNGGYVNLKTSSFQLNYLQDKEGYFIYFLEDQTIINLTDFYVTFKFFNGSTGQFTQFLTQDPSTFTNNNFNPDDYQYLKAVLNYSNYTYIYTTLSGVPIGNELNPINLYEYINP